MAELAFEKDRKREYLEKKKIGKNNIFDDYIDADRFYAEDIVKKRNRETEELEERKRKRIKELNELARKGTIYIKGGLK